MQNTWEENGCAVAQKENAAYRRRPRVKDQIKTIVPAAPARRCERLGFDRKNMYDLAARGVFGNEFHAAGNQGKQRVIAA